MATDSAGFSPDAGTADLRAIFYTFSTNLPLEKALHDVVKQAAIQVWFQEQSLQRTTGAWMFSIDTKKQLKAITRNKHPIALTYVDLDKVFKNVGNLFDPISQIALIVYYPWDVPSVLMFMPRDSKVMFSSDAEMTTVKNDFRGPALAPHCIPVLPPRTCARCRLYPAVAKCSACRLVYYCNEACQKADHDKHVVGCRTLKRLCSAETPH